MSRINRINDNDFRIIIESGGIITLDPGASGTVYIPGSITVDGSFLVPGININRVPPLPAAEMLFLENITHYDQLTNEQKNGTFVFKTNDDILSGVQVGTLKCGDSNNLYFDLGSTTNTLRVVNSQGSLTVLESVDLSAYTGTTIIQGNFGTINTGDAFTLTIDNGAPTTITIGATTTFADLAGIIQLISPTIITAVWDNDIKKITVIASGHSLLFEDTVNTPVTQIFGANVSGVGKPFSSGYHNHITHFDDLTNKKYVDDAISSAYGTTGIGVVSMANGGTGNTLVPSAGSIVYSTGSELALTGTGSAGFVLTSNGVDAPGWTEIIKIVNDSTTNASFYPLFYSANSGTMSTAYVCSSKLYYNPVTGILTTVELNTTSDIRLKENVETLKDSIKVLDKIRSVSYNLKESGRKSYGVIAQELENILPELVDTNADGIKSVNYIPLIAFLIDAIKHQQSQIDSLMK